jgi:UDPglucose 6-dehydrogenase
LLATKVSFINAMAELCDVAGADVRQLAAALGLDRRIGAEFLRAGVGYGGSCLPKDVRALAARAAELGVGEVPDLLHQVDVINCRRRARTVALARDACGGTFRGRRVAVLGLAFKPNSDDIRDSPALAVASAICDAGGNVAAFDPRAMHRAAAAEPRLACSAGVAQACRQADVVLVLTDWPQFAAIAPSCLDAVVRRRVVIDGRSCLDPGVWRAAGWSYRAVGTPDTEPARSDTAERTAELSAVGHEHP